MGRDNVSCMNQAVQCAGTLSQMAVVRIVGADPIENQIEAVRKVGDARSQTVQVESVFDVRALHFAEHLVAFEAAEPEYP